MPLVNSLESLLVWLFYRRSSAIPAVASSLEKRGIDLGPSWPLDAIREGPGAPLIFTVPDMRRHLYILGASGCGKTNCLLHLVECEVAAGRSIVLVDLRGDLIERVMLRLAHHRIDPARLHLLDLRDGTHVTPFNPLSGAGDLHSRAFHVLGVLRGQAESWGVQLEETLRNSLVALTEAGGSLVDLEGILLDDSIRSSILSRVSDPLTTAFFTRFNELSKERRLTWALPVLNKVTPLLAIPRIRAMLESPTSIDLTSILNTPGSILLVSLAVDRFHAASNLVGGLLVSSLRASIMSRVSIPEVLRNPVTLFVDEFETMASDAFLEILAEGRRFGLSLVLSHQNLAQLGGRLRAGIQTNAHLHLYFQTGAADAAEVAKEVVGSLSREEIRSLLIGFKTGEALSIRRGDETMFLSTRLNRDPHVTASAVTALRNQSFTAHPVQSAPPLLTATRSAAAPQVAWEVLDDDSY